MLSNSGQTVVSRQPTVNQLAFILPSYHKMLRTEEFDNTVSLLGNSWNDNIDNRQIRLFMYRYYPEAWECQFLTLGICHTYPFHTQTVAT